MSKNISKKSAERVVNSSLEVFTNKYMNKTRKLFGRFFVSGYIFAFILLSFSLISSTLPTQAYAENTPVGTSVVPASRTLKLTIPRMGGDDINNLQTFLNNAGYNCGTPDGVFGPKTEAEVKLFQIANNLTPDGSVGPKTKAFTSNLFTSSMSQSTVCTSGALFNTSTGQSCVNTSVSTLGCTPGALFNTITGASCGTLSVLPAGCTATSLFSITSGVSCKLRGGGSIGPKRVNPTITGVTIPAQGGTPISTLSDTTQYTATIAWTGSPSVFLASTSYTATITLTAKSGYTLSGVTADYFTVAGATSTNSIDSGVITAVFPNTPLIQLTISNPNLTTSKAYNGDTTAAVTAGSLSGILAGDTVTVSAVANYDTALVGTGKTITTVYTLGGAQAGNYTKPVNDTNNTGVITAIVINTAAIAGVTAPVMGATPVVTLADGTGYTAVISWSGTPVTFDQLTVYTATITLTAKTGYTLTGVTANFFTVSGATSVTNSADSGVISAVFPATAQFPATTPSSIVLAVGSTAPVGGVTNVAIPSAGGTDTIGVITGYVATTADKIKFTVTDAGSATSTITINGGAYTSGVDYQIIPTTSLPTIVVTTTEAGKATGVRTFVITGPILGADGLTYGIVMGADGKKWLDRNMGATRVATSFDDYQSYGSLFQWGRGADGHQLITHTTATAATPVNGNTATLSVTDTPGNNLFIKNSDWRSTQNDNLWQGVNGTNNVCPAGFRLPTNTEQQTLITAAGITNIATAFSSSLKLTAAGNRNYSDASLSILGTYGGYWSSSVSGAYASFMYFNSAAVNSANPNFRAVGLTVRCLKD